MTPLEFAWCLTCLFFGSSAQSPSTLTYQERAFVSADVGSNITLPCFYKENAVVTYWFKQTLGQKPNVFATVYKHKPNEGDYFHNEHKNNPRFAMEVGEGKALLRIYDLQTSDSATYYCVAIDSYNFEFGKGATVSVKGSNIHPWVHHTASEAIQQEGSLTMNCRVNTRSCNGDHCFYWFTEAKESRPALIYTYGGRNDQFDRTTMTSRHTCDYSLPLGNTHGSDNGTRPCAVTSCGHILFEDWKKMDSGGQQNSKLVVHLLSGALAFTIVLSGWLAFSIHRLKKTIQTHCTANSDAGPADRSSADSEGNQDEESLQYSILKPQRLKRTRREREDNMSQCVYTSVKQAKSTVQQHSVAI